MDVVSVDTRLSIEALLSKHAWFLDQHQAVQLPELYREDGSLLGVGPDKIGRDAIRRWAQERDANHHLKTRHVNTNLHIVSATEDRIDAASIVMLFRHEKEGLGAPRAAMVCDYRDVIVLQSGRWLFQERRVVPVFVNGV